MGRLRAVLRLGECADARQARRTVLAEYCAPLRRLCPGARLRHRSHLFAARARRGTTRRHRSIGSDARARSKPGASRAPRLARSSHSRRHPLSAVHFRLDQWRDAVSPSPAVCYCRRRRIRDGARAVRTSAVTGARTRSDGHARRGAQSAATGRHIRYRARCRSSVVERVPTASQLERMAESTRWVARDAGGDGASGSGTPADDLPSGVHRAPWWRSACAPVRLDLSNSCRYLRWLAASRKPGSKSPPRSVTIAGPLGTLEPRCGSYWPTRRRKGERL